MNEELDMMIDMAKESMEKALVHLHDELIKIRTGKASPAILNGLKVDYYGTPTLLTQVANVGTSDARTITIQPWEKKIWHLLSDLFLRLIWVSLLKMMVK